MPGYSRRPLVALSATALFTASAMAPAYVHTHARSAEESGMVSLNKASAVTAVRKRAPATPRKRPERIRPAMAVRHTREQRDMQR